MKPTALYLALALCVSASFSLQAPAAEGTRQAEVAGRGAAVMPFSLPATVHVLTKTKDGGTQRVVARQAADATQVRLVRGHLRDIQAQFREGDFSGPSRIHGDEMPGLAQLKAARRGEISIAYKNVDGGAELAYRSSNPMLVSALHRWFDAQLSDHGADAMAGHEHHNDTAHKP